MRSRLALVLALSILAPVGCASSPAPPQAAPASDPHAPYPYTTDAIREGCKPGHTLVFREETAGEPTTRTTFRFVESTHDDATMETTKTDDAGKVLAGPMKARVPWSELHEHGAFPREATSVVDAPVTVPAGTFQTRMYTVQRGPNDVAIYYFAKDHAGPPVLWFEDKLGKRVHTMTMLSIAE